MKLSAQSSKNSDRLTEEQRRVAGFPLTLMMSKFTQALIYTHEI